MIDLALDPSETRSAPTAQRAATRRPWLRVALFGALGVAGTGAFGVAANTYLAGLAGPQRAKPIVTSQKAADWPDLKDGLPTLAGSGPAVPKIREILPPEPAPAPVVEARIDPMLRAGAAPLDAAAAAPAATAAVPSIAVPADKPAKAAPRPLPAIVEVPVIGPTRQAALIPPARTVPGNAPLAAETVRAKTLQAEAVVTGRAEAGTTTYAALPAATEIAAKPPATKHEAARSDVGRPETAKPDSAKAKASAAEPAKAKPRIEAHAKPSAVPAAKAVAEKPAARKPAAVEARATPPEVKAAPAEDADTEVFGIKVPSLAPAGRKIRESVEALGDAVKGIPDRF